MYILKKHNTRRKIMMRTLDDIFNYYKKVYIPRDHPNYEEVKLLLTQQLKDEINDTLITRPASKA